MSSYSVRLFIENMLLKKSIPEETKSTAAERLQKRRLERTCHHGDELGKCEACYEEFINEKSK